MWLRSVHVSIEVELRAMGLLKQWLWLVKTEVKCFFYFSYTWLVMFSFVLSDLLTGYIAKMKLNLSLFFDRHDSCGHRDPQTGHVHQPLHVPRRDEFWLHEWGVCRWNAST